MELMPPIAAKPAAALPQPGFARGAVTVNLDRPRVLFFDMEATWLLHQKYGDAFLVSLYKVGKQRGEFEIVSVEAMAFFLFAGLQRDAKAHGETLSLEDVQEMIRPFNFTVISMALVRALSNAMDTPAPPGKSEAVAASPAAAAQGPGPTRVSTSSKRSGSRPQSSAKPRRNSGR